MFLPNSACTALQFMRRHVQIKRRHAPHKPPKFLPTAHIGDTRHNMSTSWSTGISQDPTQQSHVIDDRARFGKAIYDLGHAYQSDDPHNQQRLCAKAQAVLAEWDIDASIVGDQCRITVRTASKARKGRPHLERIQSSLEWMPNYSIIVTDMASWLHHSDTYTFPPGCARITKGQDPDMLDYSPDSAFAFKVTCRSTGAAIEVAPVLRFRRLRVSRPEAEERYVSCDNLYAHTFHAGISDKQAESMVKQLEFNRLKSLAEEARRAEGRRAGSGLPHDYATRSRNHSHGLKVAYNAMEAEWEQMGYSCIEGTMTLDSKTHAWDFKPVPSEQPGGGSTSTRHQTRPGLPKGPYTSASAEPKEAKTDAEWISVSSQLIFDDDDIDTISFCEAET